MGYSRSRNYRRVIILNWLNVDQIVFYGLVWTNSFLSSIFVTLGDEKQNNLRRILSVAGFSGFLAFAVVSIFMGKINGPMDGQWYYLGISTLIGLSAKYQENILRTVLHKIGLLEDEINKNE